MGTDPRPIRPARPSDTPEEIEHSLRNALMVIAGYVDLMIEDVADDEARRVDLTEVRQATAQALTLVDRLAALVRARPSP